MKPTTIDEYIASKPLEMRPRLQELRTIIGTSLPATAEAVKWGEPAFVDEDGMILVVFAGYKNHSNIVVTPSALAANADKFSDYKLGKGSVQSLTVSQFPRQSSGIWWSIASASTE